jgi:DNA-binding transcriptional regulator GbsR (MarR family)
MQFYSWEMLISEISEEFSICWENMEKVISLTSEWHFVKKNFFKIGLETNLEEG